MASAECSGAQLLISNGILSKLSIPLEDFVRSAQLAPAEQGTDWDDEAAGTDDTFPSLPAMEAVLDALEVRDVLHAEPFARHMCSMRNHCSAWLCTMTSPCHVKAWELFDRAQSRCALQCRRCPSMSVGLLP